MNLPRNPLRFNVGFLVNQQIGYHRDIHFEYPVVSLQPDLTLNDFAGKVRVSRTPQGVFVQGEFSGAVEIDCARCMEPFEQPLQTQFDELFAFDERFVTESGLILADDATIDLESIVREYLLIEQPINPICKEDCLGLCVECGQNLNEEQCEHIPGVMDTHLL